MKKEKSEERTIKVDGIRDIVVNNDVEGIVKMLGLLVLIDAVECIVRLFNYFF